jgi:hypothetical protein
MSEWFSELFGTPEQNAESAQRAEQARAAFVVPARLVESREALFSPALRPYCARCGGEGYLPSFSHIKGGACFACN